MSIQDDIFDIANALDTLGETAYVEAFERLMKVFNEFEEENDQLNKQVNALKHFAELIEVLNSPLRKMKSKLESNRKRSKADGKKSK